jgi:hypothetical protein
MKKALITIIALIITCGAAFYGGMKYAQSKSMLRFTANGFEELRNLSSGEREQRFQEMGMAGIAFGPDRLLENKSGSGFVNGEIISKENQTITVRLHDGGSKIIFYSDSTEISKFVSGASDDLGVGKSITVSGGMNEDGTVTAKTIQISPLYPER